MFEPVDVKKDSLITLPLERLGQLLDSIKEPSYRARQIKHWVFHHSIARFEEMRNIPGNVRELLAERTIIHPLKLVHITGSEQSRTRKVLFELQTGEQIETVLIHERRRTTICVSSQVGCALDCKFCATAKMGFLKNLDTAEIVDQVLQVQSLVSSRITNVVFMGMGEPFLNYDRVIAAAKILSDRNGFGLGARRITISTAGIIPGIRRFVEDGLRFKLAISLNAGTQNQREKIMPIATTYAITDLIKAARSYHQHSHQLTTFEYVLLRNVNDSFTDSVKLKNLIGRLPCKLNLIPYNEIGNKFRRPSEERLNTFLKGLKDAPFPVTVRRSKGDDIKAGCGQLVVKKVCRAGT